MKYIILILSLYSLSLYSQELQDKIYIIDGVCYIPQSDSQIAQLFFGSIDSLNPMMTPGYELPSGLLSIANNKIKYAFRDNRLITTSFFEMGRNHWGGPVIISVEPKNLRFLDDLQVREFLESYGRTYHSAMEETILDRTPLRQAIFKNDRKNLMFDFTVDEGGNLYCVIIVQKSAVSPERLLEVWRILPANKELINWASQPEREDWSDVTIKAELLTTIPLLRNLQEVTMFSLDSRLFLFDPVNRLFFQLQESTLKDVPVDLESLDSYADFALVVDIDNQAVFLMPKSILKHERKTFRELVNLYGIRIPFSK